ncbi:hypothetical protein Aph01nite_35810 [Acrocarpospora phusangensis]|uniref:DUF916 domain-containing protein n=1 Tax=Acrocarpospora phusangensis TaxID=1070424 RepID=A0A919QAJ6_9ACTN|nr:DUF916 domain-containing protein [Acrocarpospora phusangensis]GIH25271.1 hypothetical protein Aph01nite_35810 [Acrocarpospora phusangensis]
MASPRRAVALLALMCATLVGLAGPAAARDITWSVVPANAGGPDGRSVIDVELAGGQEVTEHVAVINRSTKEVVFAIDANDGYLTAKGLFDMRPSDATPTDGGAWIQIPDKVTIPAGATAIVPVKVTVPQNATPGDHPAGVTASVETISDQVRVQNRVGVRVNLRVTGDYVAKVAVTELRTEYTGSWNPFTSGSIDVTYTVANVGNVRVAPSAQIRTSALVGESGWDDTSEAKTREIMPGSSRQFTARVTGVWPMGSLTTKIVTIPSPVGQPAPGVLAERVTVDTTLWALPWPQLVLLVLLVAAFFVIRVYASRRRERLDRQAEILREASALIAQYGGKPKE